MNTAVINFKTDPKTKKQAQKIAKDLGLHLSVILNAYLKQFVRTREVHFDLNDEIPNEETIQAFKETEEYINSPEFGKHALSPQEALDYLDHLIAQRKSADRVPAKVPQRITSGAD